MSHSPNDTHGGIAEYASVQCVQGEARLGRRRSGEGGMTLLAAVSGEKRGKTKREKVGLIDKRTL